MSAGGPLSVDRMLDLFAEDKEQPTREAIRDTLQELADECEHRGIELKQVSSGYRFQAKKDYGPWVSRLWEEKPPRYSRALLETLALVAYKQPITRSEIEEVRGVSVSTHIIKTLQERDWVKAVGHRDVPGKPALYATTKAFLDYFNLKSLDELPSLQEIRDLDKINAELDVNPDADLELEEKEAALHDAEIERHSLMGNGEDVVQSGEDGSTDTDVNNLMEDAADEVAEEPADAVAAEPAAEPEQEAVEELEINEFIGKPEIGAAELDHEGNIDIADDATEVYAAEPAVSETADMPDLSEQTIPEDDVMEIEGNDHDPGLVMEANGNEDAADAPDDVEKLQTLGEGDLAAQDSSHNDEPAEVLAESESESYEQEEREDAQLEDSQLTPH